MKTTSVFDRNLDAYHKGYRIIVNKGSTRSSKTYSLLQLLFLIAEMSATSRIISIVSESMPHLKKGCIRDFREILTKEGVWKDEKWNATHCEYRTNRSIIEFFSVDSATKVHGPGRDILYVNECINIGYETYRQLAIRTTGTIFLDCNPCFEFWLDEKILPRKNEAVLIHSTYKDNEYLTAAQVREIESNKNDTAWWQVYGLGLTGTRQGLVIGNWDIVAEMPSQYKKRWIGIDFGFTNDPTAIVDMRLAGGELWIDEILYERGYDNLMIAGRLREKMIPKNVPLVADSAEPKSIAEIKSFGWKVEAARKGKDSLQSGLSVLNRYRKHITGNSINIMNEYRNYQWQTDKTGKATNIPADRYNHSIDAQRYVCLNKLMQTGGSLSYTVIKGKR